MQHPKNLLIERAKALRLGKPSFTTRNTGPEHEPLFESTVTIARRVYGRGEGGNKRDAERLASEAALRALDDPEQGEEQGSQVSQAQESQTRERELDADEPFDGPWPIFPKVLAASLSVAHARVNPTLMGEEAIEEVQSLALLLYKGTLGALGEVTELDDEAEDDTDTPGETDVSAAQELD